jgi:hypothetical protein
VGVVSQPIPEGWHVYSNWEQVPRSVWRVILLQRKAKCMTNGELVYASRQSFDTSKRNKLGLELQPLASYLILSNPSLKINADAEMALFSISLFTDVRQPNASK